MSNTYKYNVVAFAGRFQCIHLGHYPIIREALKLGEQVLILVGSANHTETLKNPWTWEERAQMIRDVLEEQDPEGSKRVSIVGIEDRLYSEVQWTRSIQDAVSQYTTDEKSKVALIGHHKDDSSYYLDLFPQWDYVEVESEYTYNATDIRKAMFNSTLTDEGRRAALAEQKFKLFECTYKTIVDYMDTERYQALVEEDVFYVEHDRMWSAAPYDPTFNCADAFVVQAGHILLVQRKAAPGKGLWALPGGYIHKNETCSQASIRELKEETKLKVPEPVLHGSKFAYKVFDHPSRSLRGRVYSHAFGFKLQNLDPNGKLQKVKGADDANKAWWFTFSEVRKMRSVLFEDHADIIEYFLGKL